MSYRIVVDDMLLPTINDGGADQYPVYLMTAGAVSEGVQQELRIATDRNILSLQDVLAVDYHYGFHVNGTRWVDGGDNPGDDDLADSDNWELAFTDIRNTDVVKLIVNTPFAKNT